MVRYTVTVFHGLHVAGMEDIGARDWAHAVKLAQYIMRTVARETVRPSEFRPDSVSCEVRPHMVVGTQSNCDCTAKTIALKGGAV